MGRRKTLEEELAKAADACKAERAKAQRDCGHYDCEPVEWYWSGQIREMRCKDCGLQEFRDEVSE